ncbi:MAG: YncE family protein [Nitrospirota bacterium]
MLALCMPTLADKKYPVSGEFIPTGVYITPTAPAGSTFQRLNPDLPGHPDFTVGQAVTTAVSPDGNTLLILTSGYNRQNNAGGQVDPGQSNEYIFAYDISGPKPVKSQVLQVPNTFNGLAWNPNGTEFYVSGGMDDDVHIFTKRASGWGESARPVSLGHTNAIGLGTISPEAAGLAVTGNGKLLVVANYENDSVSVINLATRSKVGELDLRPGNGVAGGEYPLWVSIKGNDTAYVSSMRDREIVVVSIANGAAPSVQRRIPVKGVPEKMIMNANQTRLYVTLGNSDSVAVINTVSYKVIGQVGTAAPRQYMHDTKYNGVNPNGLALSPDERTLYVTNGGANSLAVISLKENKGDARTVTVTGLIPTGWYPNSVSVSRDGSILYVVNGKSNTGPVAAACRNTTSIAAGSENACNAANQYVWQLTKAGFQTIPVPDKKELKALTEQVADNNNYASLKKTPQPSSMMKFLRGHIRHVIYIVRENRTYDQVLGDLDRGNGDPSIAIFPEPLTPNQHKLARQFVDLDNFYDSGETSGDGWNWSTSARATDNVEKTEPINYAGRGLSYDFEGTNRNINVGYGTTAGRLAADPVNPTDPNILPGTADVSAPDSSDGEAGTGYLWDGALRAGLKVRNYGFFCDLTRYSLPASNPACISPNLTDPFAAGVLAAYPDKAALQGITDQYYRGFDNKFPDFYREKEWEREFAGYEANGNLPDLEMVRLMHDHFGSFGAAISGVNTVPTQVADNDYAVGRLIDVISHSKKYGDNTLVFVIEDDAQDGPDHVDAHRSIAYIAGPYVKHGAVVSVTYTTINMIRTICAILGIKPLGINDATAETMDSVFRTDAGKWAYDAVVPDILRAETILPLPEAPKKRRKPSVSRVSAKMRHDASYWQEKTLGFDFNTEDKLDTARFNQILWEGMKGKGVPYPSVRGGQDLSKNRQELHEGHEY